MVLTAAGEHLTFMNDPRVNVEEIEFVWGPMYEFLVGARTMKLRS